MTNANRSKDAVVARGMADSVMMPHGEITAFYVEY
jgi:hypothetical protein